MTDLLPPHSIESEELLVSAALWSEQDRAEILELVPAQDYYSEPHRRVVEAMVALSERGHHIDLVRLSVELRERGHLEQIGGSAFLLHLEVNVAYVQRSSWLEHASIVRQHAMARLFIYECRMAAAVAHGHHNVAALMEQHEARVAEIGLAVTEERRGLERAGPILQRHLRDAQNAPDVAQSTGIPDLDRSLGGGLIGGDLTVVAARPGMGKTMFVQGIAQMVAAPREGYEHGSVAVFSLEMPRTQLALRWVAGMTSIEMNSLRQYRLSADGLSRVYQAVQEISTWELYIDDTPAVSFGYIRSTLRRHQRECQRRGVQLKLVVIDYLQLMSATGHTREQEVSSSSRNLKALSKELGVPILLVSQLNRKLEERKDKRPLLSDLRESGAVEQDSDNIIFLYREGYYDRTKGDDTEAIIAKQRNGATGTVHLRFDGARFRFTATDPGLDYIQGFGDGTSMGDFDPDEDL